MSTRIGSRAGASRESVAGDGLVTAKSSPRRFQRSSHAVALLGVSARVAPGPGVQSARSGQRPSVLQSDHSVVIAAPLVDHTGPAGAGIGEQVEVVADQLHLEQRVIQRHRRGGVHLLPDHDRRLLGAGAGAGAGGGGGGRGGHGPVPVVRRDHSDRRLGPRPVGCARRRSVALRNRFSILARARSRAAYWSRALASARTTGPFETQVSSTRSRRSACRGLRSWLTSTSMRTTRWSSRASLAHLSATWVLKASLTAWCRPLTTMSTRPPGVLALCLASGRQRVDLTSAVATGRHGPTLVHPCHGGARPTPPVS